MKATEAPRAVGDALGDGAFGDVWPLVSAIEGWLSKEQACALYKAAGAVEAGNWIVEIGAHHGRSTVALAKGMSSAAGLLSVDPYPDRPGGGGEPAFEAYLDNVRRLGLTHRVHLFRGTSEQAASCCELLFEVAGAEQGEPIPAGPVDRPGIGLLFVDGLHDRNSVLADIDLWEPRVVDGGLACFHDAFFRVGVTLALLQRHLLDYRFGYVGSVSNLAMFRREPRIGNTAAIRSSLRLLGRLGYFGRQMVTTAAVRRGWSPLLALLPPEEDFEY